MQKNQ